MFKIYHEDLNAVRIIKCNITFFLGFVFFIFFIVSHCVFIRIFKLIIVTLNRKFNYSFDRYFFNIIVTFVGLHHIMLSDISGEAVASHICYRNIMILCIHAEVFYFISFTYYTSTRDKFIYFYASSP